MPPVIIGGALAAAGAVGGAAIANKGASKAARATEQAADRSAEVQERIYSQNSQVLQPWQQTGLKSTDLINSGLGISGNPAAFQGAFTNYLNNSDYAFQKSQGDTALNSNFAGAGVLQSGAAMKALEKYRQDIQSGYRNEFFGALGNQQGLGFSAASAQAGVGQNYANSLGNIYQNQGANAANAALVSSQNTGNALASVANIGGNLLGYKGT